MQNTSSQFYEGDKVQINFDLSLF